MKHLMEPQPREGVDVQVIRGDIDGNMFSWPHYYYHAMEVGQGYETEFFRCPAGEPDDIEKDDDGHWYWIVSTAKSARSTEAHGSD